MAGNLHSIIIIISYAFLIMNPHESSAKPDPANSIIIGAYFIPYPYNPMPSTQYNYDYITATNIDLCDNLRVDTSVTQGWYKSHRYPAVSSALTYAHNANLLSMVRFDSTYGDLGTFENVNVDLGNRYNDIRVAVLKFRSWSDNIYGWTLWDEPGGSLAKMKNVSKLDSLIRLVNYNESIDTSWVNLLGWWGHGQANELRQMLDLIDMHNGIGSGRRPVFGVESYRFVKEDYEDDGMVSCSIANSTWNGCKYVCISNMCYPKTWEFSIAAQNWYLKEFFSAIREDNRNPEKYPWWSITKTSDDYLNGARTEGPPSEAALNMDVFFRLAWGAKGIF